MTFEEFTQKVLEKFDISLHVMRMHYTLKFNPRVIQDLEDEDDLDNVVSHSDDFANVYIVESPGVEAIEANIPNTQLALGGPHPTFPSSNASCDANPNTMMLSRGFASRCADTEYTPFESNRFREAILAHAVEGNEILRVYTYQVNHNHIAQDECSSKVRVSSKRGAVVVEDVFRTTPEYLPRQLCKDFERDHGVQLTYNQAWHLKEKAKERVYGSPRASYAYLPWLCHRLREINPGTIAEYTSHEGHFKQLFLAHAFSIQGFTMGCRPVLAIDSCHLSGPYKGALLSAIAYDADDGMFPLALGVVGSENYEDWYWFLEKLKGILDGQEVIIISDRHQGILRSVSELFGVENHAYCYRHVKENFSSFFNRQNIRGKKGKEDALLLLDNIAYARLDIDYNEAFEKLVRFNGDLARWVAENSPEHWAMSKFLKKRWDKMTTNIAESFNAWLREERHQTIYTLLMMHMDKLVAMLDTHMRGTNKWKSVVGPKTEENLMSNITRSAPITVMPYLGGTFKVFTGEVYLVVDMQQHKCTCLTWQMSGLPCPHVCAVIRTLRHDVYDYIDPCFKVSTQQLIYSGQFQPLPTHNMPKVCEAGTLQDGEGNVFPSLQPPQVRRPPGRPRQRRIESQFSHKRAIHCSRCNGIVIILTMAGNGLDGSAASSRPLSAKTMSYRMREEGRGRDKERCSGWNGDGDGINSLATSVIGNPYLCSHFSQVPRATSMFTRCSAARFKKLCNRLPEAKIQAIRDLQFGGLLNLNCTEVRHNLCIFLIQHFNVGFRRIEFSAQKHYPVTATDVGLILGLPTEGRNLQVTSTSSDHPFGPIRACEEKLLDLPVGEEFRRAFIYYACATLLAPTSRLNGCRNLWHTIHEDGFRNDVNWAQFVLDQLVEGIRRYQQSKTSWVHGCVLFLQLHYVIKFQIPSVQVPITVPPTLAWTDDLIKGRLVAEIKEFGAFGHAEIDFASQRSPTVDRTPEPETNVDHDTNVDAENSDEIWHQYHDAERAIDQYQRGIQQQLRIMRGLMHKLGSRRHSGVNSAAGGHSSYAPASTPTADDHAFPGDEYMASHAAYHVLDTPDRVVAPEYELQPSVPINVVSDGEEQPEGNVVPTNRNVRRRRVRRMAPNLLSPYISQPQTKQSAIKIDLKQGAALVFGDDLDASEELVSMHDTILTRGNLGCFQGNGWIGNDEMVIHSQAKHLVREAVIGRFEPHLYHIDIPYVNVNEVFLPVLIKNHWTLYVYDLENRRIQLLDSRPGRKKTMLSGVQQNLAKVVLWLAAHKKEVSPYDLRTFNFITPDVPLQTNEHDCGVFVMKFMELWSMGGFSKSIDVVEDHGEYVVLSTKCTPRPCPERLKGINLIVFLLKLLVNALCIYGHPRNRSRWTRGSESIKGDRSRLYFSNGSTGRTFLQPVEHTLLDERECILAPSTGDRPVAPMRSTGSWSFDQPTG
ncbi:hypothetical protein CK203_063191 [Vitis vinifera]|uniref:SWIM-type domain-containing protein n=1 Tax=Vitis vinifera TaxID=29760 RepID=A0A438G4G2_VITVI|nr:hypothetical protein CK203_063191 [Vitis vinifera]